MITGQRERTRRARMADRLAALQAARTKPPTGITSQPEPVTLGAPERGRHLVDGQFRMGGRLVALTDGKIWDIPAPSMAVTQALHGFVWLDDLAALGDLRARMFAQTAVRDWIARFGRGAGPGWTADLTGQRLIRWIGLAPFLLRNLSADDAHAFHLSLARQAVFLRRRAPKAVGRAPQLHALTGLIYACAALPAMGAHLDQAIDALDAACAGALALDHVTPPRNPEALLDHFAHLGWAAAVLRQIGHAPGPRHTATMAQIAPMLRALRHADGSLARFHDGGAGDAGRLEHVLAQAGARIPAKSGLHMGFGRLQAGRATIIMDATAPPLDAAPTKAHASTLAFELTSGRRPIVVNCGPGRRFGADWAQDARETRDHTSLTLEGMSSSRFAASKTPKEPARLVSVPGEVLWDYATGPDLQRIEAGHDAWRATHGLTHARTLDLHAGGTVLRGKDILTTLSPQDETQFKTARHTRDASGIPFCLRFHLHPDVQVIATDDEKALHLLLKSGEVWTFRAEGPVTASLETSVYFDTTRLHPRETTQVVLSGAVLSYATRVRWAFARSHDTATALRDTAEMDVRPDHAQEQQQQDADD